MEDITVKFSNYYLSKDEKGNVSVFTRKIEDKPCIKELKLNLKIEELKYQWYVADYRTTTDILKGIAKDKGYELVKEEQSTDYDIRKDGVVDNQRLKDHLVAAYGTDGVLETKLGKLSYTKGDIYGDREVIDTPVSNKIEILRGIAERTSFKYEMDWDANTLGSKLIDFMK